MSRVIREHGGWIALLGLLGAAAVGLVSLYTRAALAETDKRVTVLETRQGGTDKTLDEIKRSQEVMSGDIKELLRRVK
jgi:Tfp pilus assembly protein PilN